MTTDTLLYEELNRTWKSTTQAYFGKELGELPEETYALIKESAIQHIVAEMMKKGKDEPAAGEVQVEETDPAKEPAGETTAVLATEETTSDPNRSAEAKA